MITKKRLSAFILIVVFIFVFIFTYSFLRSQTILINSKNVEKVYIYKSSDFENKNYKPIKTISKSNQSTRLTKGDYYVAWQGSNGYMDGNKKVSLSNKKQSLEISPDVSEKKLDDMLNNQLSNINSVIKAKFPNIESLYIINRGYLYDNGEWYGTTLQYNGTDRYSADTLKIILKNNNGTWNVITEVPDLAFNKSDYGQIPTDVLDNVNQYLYAPIQDKYLSE